MATKSKRNQIKESLARSGEPVKPETPVNNEEADDDLTVGERYLMESRPYWSLIALGVLSAVLLYVFFNYFTNMQAESSAVPWRDLSTAVTQSELSGEISSLKEMGNDHSDHPAGNWAYQFAGDFELRRGLGMLNYDRAGGLKLIESAEETYRKVVDSADTAKTPMLQKRSLFSLSYATESLGKFDVAKTLYQQMIDEAGDSAFLEMSKRGVARCTNPQYGEFFTAFKEWEDVADDAPGALMPDRPSINPGLMPDFGNFEPEKKESTDSSTEESNTEMKESDNAAPVIIEPETRAPAVETDAAEGAKVEAEESAKETGEEKIKELEKALEQVESTDSEIKLPETETVPAESGNEGDK